MEKLFEISEYEKMLREWFQLNPKVLVALSGGVDSCLVAFLARKYNGKQNAIALIGVSPSLKQNDLILAEEFCEKNDILYEKIFPNEMSNENYSANPINRCYFCKSALYDEMLLVQKKQYSSYEILNGNNYSDRGDYRPGMKAASEFKALSPLMDCEIEKGGVRLLAKKYKLEVWDKPASPCLSSRFPYGERITEGKLKMVEHAENYLNDLGFRDVRVRSKKNMATVEVPLNELEKLSVYNRKIVDRLESIGFINVEIDEEGLVSGKLNREIKIE